MNSIDRVEKMNEKKALPPIFKKINGLSNAGHLEKEMCENIKVMLAGYFLYREGVEIIANTGRALKLFPEARS